MASRRVYDIEITDPCQALSWCEGAAFHFFVFS
jgi:hypothetical protein